MAEDTQTGSDQRSRLDSQKLSDDYYHPTDEMKR